MQKKPMFEDIILWKKVFVRLDRDIAQYNQYEWNEETTKERLVQKRDDLLKVATKLNERDLLLLYYLKSQLGISAIRAYKIMRKQYCTIQEFEKTADGEQTVWDIERVGAERKKRKKSKKILKNNAKWLAFACPLW